ncbi:MAG: YbhB/YbcL family Raf kinase inhibitor-like protein [Stellaceae bacterium]|jgi:Raf kinase inhibitor-like YbhB/YbcL family protein
MKFHRLAMLAAGFAAACALAASGYAADMKPKPFTVTSSSWKDNAKVERKYAGKLATNPNCDGDNVSPEISWSNAPAAAKSFAILMFDPDGGNGLGAVHWTAYGIPASKTSLKEGEGSAPNPNIVNGAAENGMPGGVYRGPCPPHGLRPHHYIITVVATDLAPDALKPGLTRADFLAALKGHALASSSFIGRYAH